MVCTQTIAKVQDKAFVLADPYVSAIRLIPCFLLLHALQSWLIASFRCILALPFMERAGGVFKEIPEPTDSDLVAGCLSGDSRSWERLLRRYERMIYSVPVRLHLDKDERQEVFQTVCCRIL